MKAQPLNDRVLVLPTVPPEKSAGGVYMPDTHEEKDYPGEGTVIAIGPGKYENGARTPLDCAVGDLVSFMKMSGTDFKLPGDETKYLILQERAILAKLLPSD